MVKCQKCQGMGGIKWRDGDQFTWEYCDACGGTGDSDFKKVMNAIEEVYKYEYNPQMIIMEAHKYFNPREQEYMNNKRIYERAISAWGEEAQLKMAIEECAELIVKLAKLGRFKNGSQIDDVVDEIADVEIMMAQLRLIFGDNAVDDRKKAKLEMLRALLDST